MRPYYSRVALGYPDLWMAQDARCFYCAKIMRTVIGNGRRIARMSLATRDHFIPRAYGATLGGNVVLSCAHCNNRAMHTLPTYEELCRFVELYKRAGRDSQKVEARWAELNPLPRPRTPSMTRESSTVHTVPLE